jgi:poly(3-hydroxyalkanoate) synthetase
VFAFVRPSTTWCGNYWVFNYLFGETPLSFEVLA